MVDAVIAKTKKCYRYRDLDTAIFLLSSLIVNMPEYRLLYGILLYENDEFSRSLVHLDGLLTTTAVYYRALAYKKMKKYKDATMCLRTILDGRSLRDRSENSWYNEFFIDKKDTEFFDSLLGELYVQRGKCRNAIDKFRKSMFKNPLLKAATSLYEENNKIDLIDVHKDDLVMKYYTELFRIQQQIRFNSINLIFKGIQCLSNTKNDLNGMSTNDENGNINNKKNGRANCLISNETCPDAFNRSAAKDVGIRNDVDLSTYSGLGMEYYSEAFDAPFIGSYYISKVAAALARFGFDDKSASLFEALRDKDPSFIEEMDNYSTLLWKLKNENMLGLLAKEYISSHPNNFITWAIIGNYYSLKGLNHECTLCFQRSLGIKESPHVYTLLGFESNTKTQFTEAQVYFKASICMLENNDRALFGLGISYAEIFKADIASLYFNQAMDINPTSLPMATYLVRFYVKNKEYEKAVLKIKQMLFAQNDRWLEDYDTMVDFIEENCGRFRDIEELMLCELVEVLFKHGHRGLAARILKCVKCRTSSYYAKKALIETMEE